MESASFADYLSCMGHDLGELVREAFTRIRQTKAATQEQWEEISGQTQSAISDINRKKTKFKSLVTLGAVLERAGVDPVELFRVATVIADTKTGATSPEDVELYTRIAIARPEIRNILLQTLKHMQTDVTVDPPVPVSVPTPATPKRKRRRGPPASR